MLYGAERVLARAAAVLDSSMPVRARSLFKLLPGQVNLAYTSCGRQLELATLGTYGCVAVALYAYYAHNE